VNNGGGDGAGCFDIKEWADTTEHGQEKKTKSLYSYCKVMEGGVPKFKK